MAPRLPPSALFLSRYSSLCDLPHKSWQAPAGRPLTLNLEPRTLNSIFSTASIISPVLEISPSWPYLISMCKLPALPPARPPAKRHKSGTPAVQQRRRSGISTSRQRIKVSKISHLSAQNADFFQVAAQAGPNWPLFST
jgi:hypothetical protein